MIDTESLIDVNLVYLKNLWKQMEGFIFWTNRQTEPRGISGVGQDGDSSAPRDSNLLKIKNSSSIVFEAWTEWELLE